MQDPGGPASGADHVDVVQCGEAGGAEEVDLAEVEDEMSRLGDVTLDVAGEAAVVGSVYLALDGDRDRRPGTVMRREGDPMVLFVLMK
jgi:hypothetical protein